LTPGLATTTAHFRTGFGRSRPLTGVIKLTDDSPVHNVLGVFFFSNFQVEADTANLSTFPVANDTISHCCYLLSLGFLSLDYC
jgi:hypothetical protein